MPPQTLTADLESQAPAPSLDRLYRVSAEVYRALIDRQWIAPDRVALVDGLLVEIDGTGTDPVEGRRIDRFDRRSLDLYRMPLEVYHELVRLDLLTKSDKVVLLDGLLVKLMGRKPLHVRATIKVFRQLSALIPQGWEVRKEDPISLPTAAAGRDSEPEPDVFLVRGNLDDFADRHPGPADLALVVEVAETTLREDRAGLARYAWANIPIAWIVNLIDQTIEVSTRPTGPVDPAMYRDVQVYQKDETLPVVVDGRELGQVAVRDLLP